MKLWIWFFWMSAYFCVEDKKVEHVAKECHWHSYWYLAAFVFSEYPVLDKVGKTGIKETLG